MPTKPRPSISAKQVKMSNSWTEALESLTINDDNWWCMMTIMVETIPSHVSCIELFDEAVIEGSRRAIFPLTFEKMMISVRTLSKIDQDKCPVAQSVFHHANKIIAGGEKLDTWLVARLVKYLVHQAKMEMITRANNEADLQRDIDRDIRAMLTVTNVESQRSMKSIKSKKSSPVMEPAVTSKPHTHLRKFGEDPKNKIYTDDAPQEGPNLYVILTGFRDPDLPLELIKAGLPLTSILKIKRPEESVELIEKPEGELDQSDKVDDRPKEKSDFGNLTEKVLSDYWSILKKSSNDPNNIEAYSSVIFRTFCPPQIPSYDEPEEMERSKKDLYDRVSFIVYDLYDIQRLHVDYIRSMKLQHVPEEPRRESMSVYTRIMNEVPPECSFVTVVLQAMLAQVETDLLREDQLNSKHEQLATLENRTDVKEIVNSSIKNQSKNGKNYQSSLDHHNQPQDQWNNHRDKPMNIHGDTQSKRQSETSTNLQVILEYDQLRLKTYHVPLIDDGMNLIHPKPNSLAELATRSLQDPRINNLWNDHHVIPYETRKKYHHLINKMAHCFNVPMDTKKLLHHLHLWFFDKMIHDRLNGTCTSIEDHLVLIMEKDDVSLGTRSDPFPLSSKTIENVETLTSGNNPISNLRSMRSDGIIVYSQSRDDIVQCSKILYAPKESPEALVELDGSAEAGNEKLGETEVDSSYLEEFIDVRRLSSSVLSQTIHECFGKFKSFKHDYVEMTDSLILCFGQVDSESSTVNHHEDKVFHHDDSQHRQVSRIVTPVCLRNFCEYVMREEKNFIREMEISRASERATSAGELTRKLSQHSDMEIVKTATFTEDDFILPNSLKDQARKNNEKVKSSDMTDVILTKNDRQTPKSDKEGRTKKNMFSWNKSSSETITNGGRNVDVDDNSLAVRKMPSLRCALQNEPYKFVGYDLGKFRIQVINERETFLSSDGTFVNVDREEWLYGDKQLGIGIDLSDCFLKLQRMIGDRKNDDMPFHLITKNGIVMAFLKVHRSQEFSSPGEKLTDAPFDFRASWPSGLSVETVRDDGQQNPFYILQRYISKGPECKIVSRENYRKFLRNGTVLKFLDRNEVEVLRPNGTIVRCLEYHQKLTRSKPPAPLGQYAELSETTTKDESSKSTLARQPTATRGKRKSSSPRKKLGKNINDEQKRKNSMVLSSDNGEIDSAKEEAAGVKITRYTAVEHDGRSYEVVNDEVSRVYDRSLVRTSTDFEAFEKFTRRDDGTHSILNSRGELIVSFPDGTRIITVYVIEDEPLCCDWSDEEFTRFFGNDLNDDSRQQSDEVISSRLSNVTQSSSYRSVTRGSNECDNRQGILLAEAFVSVLMTCRMEHECYATVTYEGLKNSCELLMPDKVRIVITRDGLFDVNVGEKTELLVRNEKLTFSSDMGKDRRSISIYNLCQRKLSGESNDLNDTLLVTTDSGGKVFKVKSDGSIKREYDEEVLEDSSSNITIKKHHRLFAINRDLTGYEYLHKWQRHDHQMKMNSNDGTGLISMIIPDRAKGLPEYRLFLNPLEPTDYSKTWLQKVTRIEPTNHDRTDFTRSTYSNPYEWLFPFGRNGNGVRKETCKVPLGESIVEDHPRVLTMTIFEGIAKEGDRFLNELRKAMVCCRRKTNKFDAYRSFDGEFLTTSRERQVEKWLNDLALGIETNIDKREYLRGLSSKRMDHKSGQIHDVTERGKPSQRESLEKEEIQWYERCVRERIILPYFKNIRGSCFLWITSCVNGALNNARNNSTENGDEL